MNDSRENAELMLSIDAVFAGFCKISGILQTSIFYHISRSSARPATKKKSPSTGLICAQNTTHVRVFIPDSCYSLVLAKRYACRNFIQHPRSGNIRESVRQKAVFRISPTCAGQIKEQELPHHGHE